MSTSVRKKGIWRWGALRSAFTTIDVVLTCSLIAFLVIFVLMTIVNQYTQIRTKRALAELGQVADAAHRYIIDHKGELPDDVDRSIPPGFQDYLADGNWPVGPWTGSVYDWDVFPDKINGPNYQISIRFCPYGQPTKCNFPQEPWAKSFDYYSSIYICIQGECKAHPDKPKSHPGYCVLGC